MEPDIRILEAYERIDDVRALFAEYINWTGIPLDIHAFEEESAELPGEYDKPGGRLYIAEVDGQLAGCVALAPSDLVIDGQKTCELKRLFVRDAHRGLGISRRLAQAAIQGAREGGYAVLLTDTFGFMERSLRLFAELGMRQVEAYREYPFEDMRYFRLDLTSY